MQKKILGTNVWWYGEQVIAQELVYEGEREDDCYRRARESLEMLDRDKLPYLSRAKVKFYPRGN